MKNFKFYLKFKVESYFYIFFLFRFQTNSFLSRLGPKKKMQTNPI